MYDRAIRVDLVPAGNAISHINRPTDTETKSCSLCQNNILHSIHLLNAVKDQLSKAINDFINIHL